MRGVPDRGIVMCSAEEVGEEERSVSDAEEALFFSSGGSSAALGMFPWALVVRGMDGVLRALMIGFAVGV